MKWLPLLLLLTFNLLADNCQPALLKGHTQYRSVEPVVIKALICANAIKFNVEPAFAMAVAHIESRKGTQEFRVGLMGKTYYGPCGIHKCFMKKWNIADWRINIEVGVRALRGVGYNKNLQVKRLRKYNAECNPAYLGAVRRATKKYSHEGVSG